MRARERRLWQRLTMLGLFCENLDAPVAGHDGQAIFRRALSSQRLPA